MTRRALVAAFALAASVPFCGSAQAQVARHFTQNTLRGALVVVQYPDVTIDGHHARMSPGGRMKDPTDLLVQPAAATGQTLIVNYTIEPTSGLIQNVWILNAAELQNSNWPHTPQQAAASTFDFATQTWTRH